MYRRYLPHVLQKFWNTPINQKQTSKMAEPIVNISTGKLRGKVAKNHNNGTFYSFQGIPYAKPPIGDLRFKAPLPAEPWDGVRDATKEGEPCIHRDLPTKNVQGGEDCLTLNVYTPKLLEEVTQQESKAVMVWIHGGGFITGSGSSFVYGPEFLMTEDVVLVTINYRLGALGFLSLEDPTLDVPGNAGLKDMVLALKWVRDNIIHFSGDPNNVTIFGESAGGAASHYLILSPLAKGLFHKSILQSGCAFNVWAKGRRCVKDIAKTIGINTTDEKKILEALKTLPTEELFLAAEQLSDSFTASRVRPHGPVVEKKTLGAFMSENPIDILKSGRYNHVPIMIGFTTREGMLYEIYQKPKPFKPLTDFELAVPHFLKLERGSDGSKMIARKIKEFYYKNEEPRTDNKDPFYLLNTDNFFLREILVAAQLHAESSLEPIFMYRMSIESELNLMKNVFNLEEPGVCHGDDLGYLFKNILTPEIKPGSDEDVAIKRFLKLWTNFAKYGDPTYEQDTVVNVKWKPVTRTEVNFLDIGKELTVHINPEPERMTFWKDILKVNPASKL